MTCAIMHESPTRVDQECQHDALVTVFSARANRGVNLLINAVGYLWGPHLVNTACISFIFLQLQFEGPKKKLKCDPG